MITDNSYDYLRGAIDAFAMLDDISRRALFEELRGMLSTVCEIQKSNEAFRKEHYNYYALLEDAIVPLQNEIQCLYSEKAQLEAELAELKRENADLGGQNAQLQVQVNQLTVQTNPSIIYGVGVAIGQSGVKV